MYVVFTLCGSLRPESANSRILQAGAVLFSGGTLVDHYEGVGSLPAFDPALDHSPGPAVEDLRRRVKSASAVLISTPEYAHGIPGSLKNALDWMVGSGELIDKPVAVVVASSTDGAFARQALVEVLRTMSAKVPDELVLGVAGIKGKLPLGGEMDAGLKKDLALIVERLVGQAG